MKSSQSGRCLAAFHFILLFAPSLFSQVIIRERVSITPAIPKMVAQSAVTSTHSFLKFQYLRRSTFPGRIEVVGPCGIDTSAESPGNPVTIFSSTELLIDPAPPGFYNVTVNTVPPNSPVSGQSVYIYDENGFQRAHDLAAPGSFDYGHLYYTGYSLTFTKETIQPNQSNRFNVVPERDCLATRFSTAGQVTLRITQGMQFGQFYRVEFAFFPDFEIRYIPLGTEITSYSSQFQEIDYLADGELPPSGGGRVVVQSEWGVVIEADTFFVQSASTFDHFEVKTEPDTLCNRDVGVLDVRAVDRDGGEVPFESVELLSVNLEEETRYLDLIDEAGDTVGNNASFQYGSLRDGLIEVVARGEPPSPAIVAVKGSIAGLQQGQNGRTTFPRVVVRVIAVSDATKAGSSNVFVQPEVNVIAVQDSIKPFYPGHIPLTESRDAIKAVVTVAGIPYDFPGLQYRVTLTRGAVDSSGGHSHIENRPAGHFLTTSGDTVRTQEFFTGSDTIRTRYQASMFGGKERVIASLGFTPEIADTDTVVVRIPDLRVLQPSANYGLVGGTCLHHGPGAASPACEAANDNHWAAGDVLDSLVSIAIAWTTEHPAEARLTVNDISLPQGGGFDVNGNWELDVRPGGAHETHRLGRDVDVRTAFPDTRSGINLRDSNGRVVVDDDGNPIGNRSFNRMCLARGAAARIHGTLDTTNEHYHLNF